MFITKLIPTLYIKLWNLLTNRRKTQYLLVFVFIIITAFAEVISLGAIIPFLGVLISPEKVYEIEKLHYLWKILGIKNSSEILLPVTTGFAIAAVIAGGLRLGYLYISTRLSFAIGADLSIEIYKRTLYQSYSLHVSRNSADVISGITAKANGVVYYILLPILNTIASIILMTVILIGLLSVDVKVTSIAFATFGLLYFAIALRAKKRLFRDGEITSKNQTILQKALQEGLGAIRDVILDGSQKFYIKLYKNADIPYRRALGNSQITSSSPRYIIEALGIVLMAAFAYYLSVNSDNLISVIPLLGSLAMGAQRLLPVLQQLYSSWAYLKIGKATLSDVIFLLEQPFLDEDNYNSDNDKKIKVIGFDKLIELDCVSFRYGDDLPFVLQNISLNIEKGQKIGFIGKTGSGKSTLIDLIMGLLIPSVGKLKVDDIVISNLNAREWQKNIAHVPQTIYLSDSTIAENIAFGIPNEEINMERVQESARKAQIDFHINSLKLGYNTLVGERGIRLSGGQRQRIGIARALYKQSSVIVFDEATSALDNDTEKAVMDAIENLGKELTIIMIAHRLSTVEKCDTIVKLHDGKLQEILYK